MALRTKTIEYAFAQSIASVASATARDFTRLAVLSIPENSSRTFRSVVLKVAAMDNGAAAANVTAVLIGIGLGAAGRDDATVTYTMTNSGENQAFVWSRDVTAYFAANYTGTSMTADCRLTVTGLSTINCNAKLVITYEYDDASATTRIKTVKIPMDGNTGNLTASFVNMGGVASQIPNLSTFLPEPSKVYRSIFFQMDTHSGTSGAATSALSLSYDGGSTTVADTSWGWTLASDVMCRRIDELTATLSTSAAGSIQAKTASTSGSPYPCLNGVLVVTYEYDHSSITQVINSLQFSIGAERSWMGGTATGDKSRFVLDFWIEEPGTITLLQSAIWMGYNGSAGPTVDHRCGSQASRTFAHGATVRCGGMSHMRRIDAGGAGGVGGFTIARGKNTIVLDAFATSAASGNVPDNASAVVYLNYLSDVHADGDGVHNHTVFWAIWPYSVGGGTRRQQVSSATTPIIPETEYYINSVTYEIFNHGVGVANSVGGRGVLCEVQSGEAQGAGWRHIQSSIYESDTESGKNLVFARASEEFLRWPADWQTDVRMDIEAARDYRFDAIGDPVGVFQMFAMITYHSIVYHVSDSVTASAGGTVTIHAHRTDTGERIGTTSRTGNGAYSIPWYDNTVDCFSEAWESGTLVGRSDNGVAT